MPDIGCMSDIPELSGSERVCPDKSDIIGVIMKLGEFVDENGYVVKIGETVSFTEFFEEYEMSVMDGKSNLVYIVTDLPNMGDMVEMREAFQMYKNAPKESGLWAIWEIVPESRTISVEPWRIGCV